MLIFKLIFSTDVYSEPNSCLDAIRNLLKTRYNCPRRAPVRAAGSGRIYFLICHPCKFTKITPGAIFIYPSEVCSQRVDGPLEPERDLDRAVVSQVAYPRPEQINHQIKCSIVEDTAGIKIRQGKGGVRHQADENSWAQSKRFHGCLFLDTLCSAWNKHQNIYICAYAAP